MLYIKYLDPIVYTTKFIPMKDIESMSPRIIEVVGFKADENDKSVYISNSTSGNSFKRVMCIPKDAIVETREILGEVADIGVKEISYIDTQITGDGIALTLKKLRNMPEPPVVNLCGFLVREDEENITLAMEKNVDGMFRTINIIPKRFILKSDQPTTSGDKS